MSDLSPLRPSLLVKPGDRMSDGTEDIYEAWHRHLGHAEYRITIEDQTRTGEHVPA